MLKESGEARIIVDDWRPEEPLDQLRPMACDGGWWGYTDFTTKDSNEDISYPGPESDAEGEESEGREEDPVQTADEPRLETGGAMTPGGATPEARTGRTTSRSAGRDTLHGEPEEEPEGQEPLRSRSRDREERPSIRAMRVPGPDRQDVRDEERQRSREREGAVRALRVPGVIDEASSRRRRQNHPTFIPVMWSADEVRAYLRDRGIHDDYWDYYAHLGMLRRHHLIRRTELFGHDPRDPGWAGCGHPKEDFTGLRRTLIMRHNGYITCIVDSFCLRIQLINSVPDYVMRGGGDVLISSFAMESTSQDHHHEAMLKIQMLMTMKTQKIQPRPLQSQSLKVLRKRGSPAPRLQIAKRGARPRRFRARIRMVQQEALVVWRLW